MIDLMTKLIGRHPDYDEHGQVKWFNAGKRALRWANYLGFWTDGRTIGL